MFVSQIYLRPTAHPITVTIRIMIRFRIGNPNLNLYLPLDESRDNEIDIQSGTLCEQQFDSSTTLCF